MLVVMIVAVAVVSLVRMMSVLVLRLVWHGLSRQHHFLVVREHVRVHLLAVDALELPLRIDDRDAAVRAQSRRQGRLRQHAARDGQHGRSAWRGRAADGMPAATTCTAVYDRRREHHASRHVVVAAAASAGVSPGASGSASAAAGTDVDRQGATEHQRRRRIRRVSWGLARGGREGWSVRRSACWSANTGTSRRRRGDVQRRRA